MSNNTKVKLTGIVKTSGNEYCFRIICKDQEKLNKLKDAARWILLDSSYTVVYNLAKYDTYRENGDRK